MWSYYKMQLKRDTPLLSLLLYLSFSSFLLYNLFLESSVGGIIYKGVITEAEDRLPFSPLHILKANLFISLFSQHYDTLIGTNAISSILYHNWIIVLHYLEAECNMQLLLIFHMSPICIYADLGVSGLGNTYFGFS